MNNLVNGYYFKEIFFFIKQLYYKNNMVNGFRILDSSPENTFCFLYFSVHQLICIKISFFFILYNCFVEHLIRIFFLYCLPNFTEKFSATVQSLIL